MVWDQLDEFGWNVIRTSRAVGPQRFALPNNFMIGNTLQTKGSIRVLRKRVNAPMQLLLINRH